MPPKSNDRFGLNLRVDLSGAFRGGRVFPNDVVAITLDGQVNGADGLEDFVHLGDVF